MYTGIMLICALLLVCLNGIFVAAEFAFVKVRKTRLELLASAGNKRAQSALFGIARLDSYLSVGQLGITLSSLGLGWLGEPVVAAALRPVFSLLPLAGPTMVTSLSVAAGFAAITLIHVVFGELLPKSVSIQKAEQAVLLLARPMHFFYVLCFPMVSIMNGISGFFLRRAGVGPTTEAEHSHSPEELRLLVLESSQDGSLDKEAGRLLDNIFSFYQKTAKDVMIHRVDVTVLNMDGNKEDALTASRRTGHTRFPVYEENRDNVMGFIHIRDVVLHRGRFSTLRSLTRTPLYIHEGTHLDKLLTMMRIKRQQLCFVVDEYGLWQGIVTMEDIVEAIVGDIQDEFDHEEPDIVAGADNTWSVSGDLSLDDMAEYMPLDCKDPDVDMYRIIAAHLLERLERIPETGDFIDLCGKRFTVTRMEKRRVRRVCASNIPADETK